MKNKLCKQEMEKCLANIRFNVYQKAKFQEAQIMSGPV